MFVLLTSRRFLPLFLCQFFSAFNDNFVRNMLAILVLFEIGKDHAGPMITLAIGLFMLPSLLLSGLAGELADSRDKASTAQWLKFGEIGVQIVAAAGFWFGSIVLLYVALVGLGTISALFSPIKYGILPDHLKTEELTAGNALVEAATFFAILLGIVVGGYAAMQHAAPLGVVVQLMVIALVSWVTSRFIPPTAAAAPGLKVNPNVFASTWQLLRELFAERRSWTGGLVTSWFWMIGAVALSLVPVIIKDRIGGNVDIELAVNALFAIGIAIGSLVAALIAHGRIVLLPVPIAGIVMAVFLVDMGLTTIGIPKTTASLDIMSFLRSGLGIHVALDVIAFSAAGGVFIVPAFTAVQAWAGKDRRARVVAAVCVLNALFMVAGTLVTAVLQAGGLSEPLLLVVFGALTLAASLWFFRALSGNYVSDFLQILFRALYRVEVKGAEHVEAAGARCVIAANHVSHVDPPLVVAALGSKPSFVMDTGQAEKWYVKPILPLFDVHRMDPTKPLSTRSAIQAARDGKPLAIFPEGRISVTGTLMKVYDGAGMIADKADAMVVPLRIEGPERTPFSFLNPTQMNPSRFPKVRMTFMAPRKLEIDENLRGRARREAAGRALYDVMSDLWFETAKMDRTIIEAVAETAKVHGRKRVILEDPVTGRLTAKKVLIGAAVLARKIMAFTRDGENVGLMLPNANGAAVTYLALQAAGRVPAMLNYTSGAKNLEAACKAAQIRTVLTSRAFVEKGRFGPLVEALEKVVTVRWLEDIRATIGTVDKLRGLFEAGKPLAKRRPGDPAAVVFTSGSEGTPKGVVLSHRNILANCFQVLARVDLNHADVMFNALPIFHSFGMTAGLVLPLVAGMKTVLYPSPLHYRQVPEFLYMTNATVLISTDTFLAGYARMAHPYNLRSLRYICAGAEPVKPATRKVYAEKYGHKIYEGYGVTETSPVLALNTPMGNRLGCAGRLMPAVEYRLEPVPGVEEGGRLQVRGPNVMLGYYRAENPGVLEPPADGWHDTGDICDVDTGGYVTIKGRAKRFAKIGGEMVSLAAVETAMEGVYAEHPVCAVAMPDAKKGERVVAVTTNPDAQRGEIAAHMKQRGAKELMLPAEVVVIAAIPVLGSGKTDYLTLDRLVRERAEQAEAA